MNMRVLQNLPLVILKSVFVFLLLQRTLTLKHTKYSDIHVLFSKRYSFSCLFINIQDSLCCSNIRHLPGFLLFASLTPQGVFHPL